MPPITAEEVGKSCFSWAPKERNVLDRQLSVCIHHYMKVYLPSVQQKYIFKCDGKISFTVAAKTIEALKINLATTAQETMRNIAKRHKLRTERIDT